MEGSARESSLMRVAALARRGMKAAEIARATGFAEGTVRVYMRRAEDAGHDLPPRRKGPDPSKRPRVLALLRAGMSVRDAAAALGISEPCAHRLLYKARRLGEADDLPAAHSRSFVGLRRPTALQLEAHAARRGCTTQEIASRILAAVAAPGPDGRDLVDAVLDDMGGGDE